MIASSALYQSHLVREDKTICCSDTYFAEPLYQSEVGRPPILVFQVSKTYLVPSPPQTTSFEEPFIRTLLFHLEAVLCPSVIIYLLCSARWIQVPYIREADPCSYAYEADPLFPEIHERDPQGSYACQADPYPLCSSRTPFYLS